MKAFWKKFGWFALCFVPLIISIAVQLIMGVILSVICSVIAIAQMGASYNPMDAASQQLLLEMVLEQTTGYSGIMIFCYHILATLGFGLWYYLMIKRPKLTNPAKVFRGKCIPATVILSFGLCLFANAFILVGQYVAPKAIEAYAELVEAAGLGTDTFAIIASILLAPIGEELLCRGLIYHYAKKVVADADNRRVAFWIANSIQALCFGIMHMNLVQGLYAFFLGLGLGWLRERYNSLYPAMLAHAIINFCSTYIIGYLLEPLPESAVTAVLVMVVSLVITIVGVWLGMEKKVAVEASAKTVESER